MNAVIQLINEKGKVLILVSFAILVFAFISCNTAPEGDKDKVIKVELTEYNLEIDSDSIKPGVKVFEVTNNGDSEHSFVIEGIDTMQRFEDNLKPGETRRMNVELEPSRYNVYCPVDDHKNKGMASVIKVEEPEEESTPAPGE
ncbi:MAG: cupredoxin domain-containing protein [Deltaproteobacteria bacterium]